MSVPSVPSRTNRCMIPTSCSFPIVIARSFIRREETCVDVPIIKKSMRVHFPTRIQHFQAQQLNQPVVGKMCRTCPSQPFRDETGRLWWTSNAFMSLFHKPWVFTTLRSQDKSSSFEVVLDIPKNVLSVQSGLTNYGGSFNIFHPNAHPFRHFVADVLPSLIYGPRSRDKTDKSVT